MANGDTLGPTNGRSVAGWIKDWIPLISLVIAGLVWGMKLEARWDTLNERMMALSTSVERNRAQVERGILPRAEERLTSIDKELIAIRRELKDCTEHN